VARSGSETVDCATVVSAWRRAECPADCPGGVRGVSGGLPILTSAATASLLRILLRDALKIMGADRDAESRMIATASGRR